MASSKLMPSSSNPRNSDLPRREYSTSSSSDQQTKNTNRNTLIASTSSTMTVDGLLRDVYGSIPSSESTLLDAQITLVDTPVLAANTVADLNQNQMINHNSGGVSGVDPPPPPVRKSVDEVWREIVSGERKEMKVEAQDEIITLEDFLAKAGALDDDDDEIKMPTAMPSMENMSGGVYPFDHSPLQELDKVEGSIIGFGNGVEMVDGGGGSGGIRRGKRGRGAVLEQLDKAAQQRQRRMIKNRESAARSRERKQVT